KPGMFATAHVQLPGTASAVFVPKSAVLRDKTTDSNQVFTISDGKAHLHVVAIQDATGDEIRLASGLVGGETVATSNLSELFDGAPVNVQKAMNIEQQQTVPQPLKTEQPAMNNVQQPMKTEQLAMNKVHQPMKTEQPLKTEQQ